MVKCQLIVRCQKFTSHFSCTRFFGIYGQIRDVCRRFAKLGCCVIAPEIFAREGDLSKITDIANIVSKVVAKVQIIKCLPN